jgi:hypothetical protein
MARIRWSIEEQQVIISQAALIISEKKAFSMREAFSLAQVNLPKHRQRDIAALSQVPWFTDGVPKRIKEIDTAKHKTFEEQLANGIEEARGQERDRLEDELAQKAGSFFAKVFMYALEDPALRRKIFLYLPNAQQVASVSRSHKDRKTRVVVAGLLNGQARTIEEKFSEQLDLRFWSKDQSHDALKQILAHADVAIGMVSFLPHSADGILKASKIPYHPISGGVTHIKQALDKLV